MYFFFLFSESILEGLGYLGCESSRPDCAGNALKVVLGGHLHCFGLTLHCNCRNC